MYFQDLNHYTTGWVDWNIALDMEGGPNWVNNFVDAPIIINATAYEFYKQPFFYALGHFSKFLLPDSVKVQLSESEKIDKFETTAFVRPDNATVVIALNMNDFAVELTIDDPNNGHVSRKVNPRSLQTYIFWN
jgi:glucosylceramidase